MTDGSPIEFIEGLVKTVGAHRLVFGSDLSYPFLRQYLPAGHRTNYLRWRNLNAVALADITEDQRDSPFCASGRERQIQPRRDGAREQGCPDPVRVGNNC